MNPGASRGVGWRLARPGLRHLAPLLHKARYEVFPSARIEEEVLEWVPRNLTVTITASPTKGLEPTLDLAGRLRAAGYSVVPHLAARQVRDAAQLADITSRLLAAGVENVFVPAGDADPPAGRFASALDLLEALADLGSPFPEVGITGYPETHPKIDDDVTIQSMWDKRRLATYIVSNLCFDPAVLRHWIRRIRRRGVTLPLLIGVAGPVERARLMRMAAKIGVADSARFVAGHSSAVFRLSTPGGYQPERLLGKIGAVLAAPESNVVGLHVFTFNQLQQTEGWRRRLLAKLPGTATDPAPLASLDTPVRVTPSRQVHRWTVDVHRAASTGHRCCCARPTTPTQAQPGGSRRRPRSMRARLPLVAPAVLATTIVLAGCAAASGPTGSLTPSSGGAARHCAGAPTPYLSPGLLTGAQFVSRTSGWVVGQDKILATTDGGRHWIVQDTGKLDLTSVDFITSRVGWAVGLHSVLATADGGAHWTALPEPCPLIRSVHFVTPDIGFAVAGGNTLTDLAPKVAGVVLVTSDGGRHWRSMTTPANAQTVCFTDPGNGWLGASGRLYRTVNAGRRWVLVTAGAGPNSAHYPSTMIVQCAGSGSAWALDIGFGAASSQQPHVGYHAGLGGAVPIFAEGYFPHPGAVVRANSPGSYAGPFSAISPSAAVFIDWCPACEPAASTPWDLATTTGASGITLTREGNVGGLTQAAAASFLSTQVGWVAGIVDHFGPTGISQARLRIVFTADGGRTWHVQYTSPAIRG